MNFTSGSYWRIAVAVLIFLALYVVSHYDYRLFHCLAEGFSIVVASAIFLIAWNARAFLNNNYLIVMGVACLFVAGIDFFHTLAYKGMNIFPRDDANLPTQLWIAARYLQSGSLLIAPFFLGRKLHISAVFVAFSVITTGILTAIFLGAFPDCFVEGVGLTPFKIISEYVICLMLAGAAFLLIHYKSDFDKTVLKLLLLYIGCFAASELAFTSYASVYGFANFIGHYLKIVCSYFLYKAIIETGLRKPYDVLFRDLEKKREALAQERNFVTAILDTVSALVIVLDPEGRIVGFNRACEKLAGFTFEEVKGQTFWDLFVPPEEAPAVKEVFGGLFGSEFSKDHEGHWMAKDGSRRLIAWSITVIRGASGQIDHVIGTGVDITERKRVESEIVRAKEEWEKTFDAVPDLIMILDLNHRIVRANRAMAARLAAVPEDLSGKACFEAVHGTQCPPGFCVHSKLMADGLEHTVEVFEESVNGLFAISCSPLRDRQGKLWGSVHVARDITERKKVEQTLASTVEELRQSALETEAMLASASALLHHRDFQESARRIFDACKGLIGAKAGYVALLNSDGSENEVLYLDPGGYICSVDPNLPMPVRGLRAETCRAGKPIYENDFPNSQWLEFLPPGHVRLENALFAPLMVGGKAVGLIGLGNKPGGFNDNDARLSAAFAEFAAIGLLNSWTLESLELSEQRVRSIVQTANDAIICIDSRGQVVLWNRKAEDIFGYSSSEAVGRSFDFVAFRKLNGGQGNIVLAELTTGEPEEVACLRKNRTEFPAEISIAPWKGKEGEFFTVIVRDITERKRSEEALKENEKRFRSTFEQAAVGIAHVALDGRYVRANQKICDILGHTSAEFVDLTFRDITHPDDLGEIIEQLRRLLSGEVDTFCSEKRMVRKDGSFVWINLTASLHRDKLNAPNYFILVVEDISRRKATEQALQATLSELERSNSELQQFAYVASHDLQEPLRMVSSYVRLLERRYKEKLDADADEFITYAADGAKRMQRLINDLLQYSRVGSRRRPFEPTDCEAVLNQVLANLQVAIERTNAQITRDPLPTVMADKSQLEQVFQNLIDNALKFRGEAPPVIHVSARRNGSHWIFSVRDNGVGIDAQYSDRIFVIFQRLHGREEYPGTGIGLAICKKIVERHDGRIWVESNGDQGSSFFFTVIGRGDDERRLTGPAH